MWFATWPVRLGLHPGQARRARPGLELAALGPDGQPLLLNWASSIVQATEEDSSEKPEELSTLAPRRQRVLPDIFNPPPPRAELGW